MTKRNHSKRSASAKPSAASAEQGALGRDSREVYREDPEQLRQFQSQPQEEREHYAPRFESDPYTERSAEHHGHHEYRNDDGSSFASTQDESKHATTSDKRGAQQAQPWSQDARSEYAHEEAPPSEPKEPPKGPGLVDVGERGRFSSRRHP